VSSYDGGKGGAGVYQWIINHIPPHSHYIDLFLGNSAVLRYKRLSDISVGIEINPAVIAEYWRYCNLPGVIVRHGDALNFLDELEREADGDTFVYADPPYLMETRSCQRQLYQFELAEREEHLALLTKLKALPCMVALSGYWSALYAEELDGWRTDTFRTVNHAGKPTVEWLWMNYPVPLELHDYRYLGKNFRERERIKRKKQRWTERLKRMPDQERYALLDAITSLRSDNVANSDAPDGGIAGADDSDEQARSAVSGDGRRQRTLEELSPHVAMADRDPDPLARSDDGRAHRCE